MRPVTKEKNIRITRVVKKGLILTPREVRWSCMIVLAMEKGPNYSTTSEIVGKLISIKEN